MAAEEEDGDCGATLPPEEEPFDGTLPIAQLGEGMNGGKGMPEKFIVLRCALAHVRISVAIHP